MHGVKFNGCNIQYTVKISWPATQPPALLPYTNEGYHCHYFLMLPSRDVFFICNVYVCIPVLFF